jgi:ATP-dependent phosphofructokinase / diphosphate-dependent phosphofructokinase
LSPNTYRRNRIGILIGGGDCPGLNAVLRAVVKASALRGWEVLGFHGGFEGLLSPVTYDIMDYRQMGALLYRGGTILGTSNKGRFSAKVGHGEVRTVPAEIIREARQTLTDLGCAALVVLGGDGTLTIAHQLWEAGIPVVGIPKTIDNDLNGTYITFGFDSAVASATDALDRLTTTGESHKRVMILEVMGRYAGWIAMSAGIAGGADVILLPEIPFTYDAICAKIRAREAENKRFTIMIVAEGAREDGGEYISSHSVEADREARLGGIAAVVAQEVERRTGKETRTCVLGHLQRGGPPSPVDRQLCTRFGVVAVEMIAQGLFGHMAAFHPPEIVPVPLTSAIGGIRQVPLDGEMVRTARALGISLGDERAGAETLVTAGNAKEPLQHSSPL